MSCPDCTRARRFSIVNGGSWWRARFAICWACFKRRGDWWRRWHPLFMAVGAVLAIAAGFLARGRGP